MEPSTSVGSRAKKIDPLDRRVARPRSIKKARVMGEMTMGLLIKIAQDKGRFPEIVESFEGEKKAINTLFNGWGQEIGERMYLERLPWSLNQFKRAMEKFLENQVPGWEHRSEM